jgi:hypothetical protein
VTIIQAHKAGSYEFWRAGYRSRRYRGVGAGPSFFPAIGAVGCKCMDKAEVEQIAVFLAKCHRVVRGWESTDTMSLYLYQLYKVIHRMQSATADRTDRDTRSALALAANQARRLRRQIEERLGIRN